MYKVIVDYVESYNISNVVASCLGGETRTLYVCLAAEGLVVIAPALARCCRARARPQLAGFVAAANKVGHVVGTRCVPIPCPTLGSLLAAVIIYRGTYYNTFLKNENSMQYLGT